MAAGALVHHHLVDQLLRLWFEAGDHPWIGHLFSVGLGKGLALGGLRGVAFHEGIEPRALLRRHVVHLLFADAGLRSEYLLQFGGVLKGVHRVTGILAGDLSRCDWSAAANRIALGQQVVRQFVQVRYLLVQLSERDLHAELLTQRCRYLREEERIEAHFQEGLIRAGLSEFKSGAFFQKVLDLRDQRFLWCEVGIAAVRYRRFDRGARDGTSTIGHHRYGIHPVPDALEGIGRHGNAMTLFALVEFLPVDQHAALPQTTNGLQQLCEFVAVTC